jgi:hypothetical protein
MVELEYYIFTLTNSGIVATVFVTATQAEAIVSSRDNLAFRFALGKERHRLFCGNIFLRNEAIL